VIEGGDGADTIQGGDGNDVLRGQDGNDTINGGQGDDALYPGLGDDSVHGGAGEDTVFYQRDFDNYLLQHVGDLVIVTDLVGNGGVDRLEAIEHVVFLGDVGHP
jgi:Ca2+-binding RTX toxin-like protein